MRTRVAVCSAMLLAACGGSVSLPGDVGDACADRITAFDDAAPSSIGAIEAGPPSDGTAAVDVGAVGEAGEEVAAEANAGPDATEPYEAGREATAAIDGALEPDAMRYPWYCDDNIQDYNETDVDCGGSCPPCWFGQKCLVHSDCSATAPACDAKLGGCACDAVSMTCVVDACIDHKKDGAETDVDCGGGKCPGCAVGQACAVDADCTTSACDGSACDAMSLICVSDPCADHRQDGMESDIDCGGPTRKACGVGQYCHSNFDCLAGNFCNAGTICQ